MASKEDVLRPFEGTSVSEPLRDLLARRYGFSKAPDFPADLAGSARKLMIDACRAVDSKAGDQIPDFIYTWWQPGARP